MRQEIEQRFKAEAERLEVLRERSKTQVARWIFSTQEIWSDDLRVNDSDLSILPGPEGAFFACGLDRSGKTIALRHFDSEEDYTNPGMPEIPSEETWAEEFISHRDDMLGVVRFVRGELQAVRQMMFKDRLLIEEELFRDGCYQHTRFQYERRRMALQESITEKGRVFFEIVFGPHGEQTYFNVRRDGTRFQLGQPFPRGVTVKSVKQTIRNRLVALVPEVVAAAGISEPIYCVALAYDGEGNDLLPPAIGVGLDSERKRWQAEHGKSAWQWVWNPAEFQNFEKSNTQLEDETLEEACDRLNGKLAAGDSSAPAIKLLVGVAAELNNVSWPARVQRTSDFVVYAVDFELSSLRKNLKIILAPERIASLRAMKLL